MLNRVILLVLTVSMVSCGWGPFKRKHDDQATRNPVDDLNAKRATYIELNSTSGDKYGFVHEKCDSVGFTSLCQTGGGCARADIFLAEVNGKWSRDAERSCYPGEAKTSISKDMLLMIMTRLWSLAKTDHDKALDALKRLEQYGKDHNWIMGEPSTDTDSISRVALSPGLANILFDMIGKLNGAKLASIEHQPTVDEFRLNETIDAVLTHTGFEAHLDVLFVLLTGRVYGAISDINLKVLKKQASRQPNNGLFQAVLHRFTDGDQTAALAILLDPKYFPEYALPGTALHCEDFLWQRDEEPSNWAPCGDQNVTHSGADFLFASDVVVEHVTEPTQ